MSTPELSGDLQAPEEGDEVCRWWTDLLTCALHWEVNEMVQARTKYSNVRTCPQTLVVKYVQVFMF